MKNIPSYLLMVFLVISCYSKQGKTSRISAEEYLLKIDELIQKKDFYTAKFQIDSISKFYPNDLSTQRQGLAYLRQINVKEAERNLTYYNNLISENKLIIEELKKKFTFEPSSVAGLPGRYIHKSQSIQQTYRRSYLRANVEENGKFYLSSHFCSDINIKHSKIKVSAGDLFVISDSIPLGGGFNRRFDDGNGTKWEVVIYNADHDGGIFNFISENTDKTLQVSFIGRSTLKSIIPENDKKAILYSKKLSDKILEQNRLRNEVQKISQFIAKSDTSK